MGLTCSWVIMCPERTFYEVSERALPCDAWRSWFRTISFQLEAVLSWLDISLSLWKLAWRLYWEFQLAIEYIVSLLQFQFYMLPPFSHWLKSETAAILAAISVQFCHPACRYQFPKSSSISHPSSLHPTAATIQGAIIVHSKDCFSLLNCSPCLLFCLSILFSTLQLECCFSDLNLEYHSFASKPKLRILGFKTG